MTTLIQNTPANGGQILRLRDEALAAAEQWAERARWNAENRGKGGPGCEDDVDRLCDKTHAAIEALASLAAPAIPTDHDEAVTLLSAVFDAWENGDDCHEEGDPSGTYLGKCFPLDDDVFKRCCDLLNRLNPPRNVAPAIPTVDRNTVAEEGAEILGNMIESIEKHGNYSQEATITFLSQAKQCFDEIKSVAAPAPVSVSEHDEPTHSNHPGHHDGHTCEAMGKFLGDLGSQRASVREAATAKMLSPAPVSGMPDLASLQRFVCDLRNSYGMRDDDQGAWVLLADVERLLNPAGETK